MYNKIMTDTLIEYRKIKACIETCEDINQLNSIWDVMFKHYIRKTKKRIKQLINLKCLINFKRLCDLFSYIKFVKISKKDLFNTGNEMVAQFQEQFNNDQKLKEKQIDIACQMAALSDYYKPHVTIKGFNQ